MKFKNLVMRENPASQDMTEPENIKKAAPRKDKKPPKKITEKYLYNSGLAYLQRFPASTPHFRRIMSRKIERSCNYHKEQDREGSNALLDGAIATFTRMGLLNDDAYLQGMVNSLRRRGLSRQAILSKLQQKGLSSGEITRVLSSHEEESGNALPADFAAALLLARRKRLGPFRKIEADRNKELAAIARAGFDFETAQKILALSLTEAEEFLNTIRI